MTKGKGMGGTPAIDRVICNGLCIGCGVCTLRNPHLKIIWDQDGCLRAHEVAEMSYLEKEAASRVCPFSDAALDETTLARSLYGASCPYFSKELGWFRATYVGYVTDDVLRMQGSSGAIGRWLTSQLLLRGLVSACIHVSARKNDAEGEESLFAYILSSDIEEVVRTARSAYYPVQLGEVLRQVRTASGTCVVVGVPCFIKAVRLLQKEDELLAHRIRFTVGLFCGHLKSRFYAEMLAWQLGIGPGQLGMVDFREKSMASTAKNKGFVAKSVSNRKIVGPVSTAELFGGDYALGFFQPRACDYCDDVAAETADVTLGDAWLPEYMGDARGTSVIVVRSPILHSVLEEGAQEGKIFLKPISPKRVVESQAGAFRHRREGLAFRLFLDKKSGRWYPKKRVTEKAFGISQWRQKVYMMRMQLREESFRAFREAKFENDFSIFIRAMEPLVVQYRRLYRDRLPAKVKAFVRRFLRSIWR